ncbi:hypothetical protein COO60DRAFT_258467 [Scenedesmus sp. NREL 46B-D3]|nr:hypothetical protein COO60DRAFT_258467 [Scenedesmus sp. NREL 46B-D3]
MSELYRTGLSASTNEPHEPSSIELSAYIWVPGRAQLTWVESLESPVRAEQRSELSIARVHLHPRRNQRGHQICRALELQKQDQVAAAAPQDRLWAGLHKACCVACTFFPGTHKLNAPVKHQGGLSARPAQKAPRRASRARIWLLHEISRVLLLHDLKANCVVFSIVGLLCCCNLRVQIEGMNSPAVFQPQHEDPVYLSALA